MSHFFTPSALYAQTTPHPADNSGKSFQNTTDSEQHNLSVNISPVPETSSPERDSLTEDAGFFLAFTKIETLLKIKNLVQSLPSSKESAPHTMTTLAGIPSEPISAALQLSTAMKNISPAIVEQSQQIKPQKHSPLGHGNLLLKDIDIHELRSALSDKAPPLFEGRILNKLKQSNNTISLPKLSNDLALNTAIPETHRTLTAAITPNNQEIFLAKSPELDTGKIKPLGVPIEAAPVQNLSAAPTERVINFQLNAPAQNTPLQGQANAMLISETLVKQMAREVSSLTVKTDNPLKSIMVQLSPAELGRVQIQYSFDGYERVTANIIAESPETGTLLRQRSDVLFSQLKLGGFDNVDLNFETNNESNFSSFGSGGSKEQDTQAHKNSPRIFDTEHALGKKKNMLQTPPITSTISRRLTNQLDIIL